MTSAGHPSCTPTDTIHIHTMSTYHRGHIQSGETQLKPVLVCLDFVFNHMISVSLKLATIHMPKIVASVEFVGWYSNSHLLPTCDSAQRCIYTLSN